MKPNPAHLADKLLEADARLRAGFTAAAGIEDGDEEEIRRETYVTIITEWLEGGETAGKKHA